MRPAEAKKSHWVRYNIFLALEHILGYSLFEKLLGNRRKKLYQAIDLSLLDSDRGGLQDLDEVERQVSLDEFKKLRYRPDLVKVFRKAAIDWPTTKKWSLEFFEEHYGDYEVFINDNEGFNDHKNPQEFQQLTFGEYIRMLKSGSLNYLKFSRLVHHEKALQEDLDKDWLRKFQLPTSFGESYYMFMGGKGTVTPIHCGFVCTVFVQVTGTKKWTIYTSGERMFLDIRADRRMYFHSKADPADLDDANFPLLKHAKKYEVILEPGDVLWIPPMVWHHVENVTDSIGVAYKFPNIPAAWKSSKILTTLFFLATKPTVFKALWVSLTKDDDYIFTKRESSRSTETVS